MLKTNQLRRIRHLAVLVVSGLAVSLAFNSPAIAIERHPAPSPTAEKTSRLPGDTSLTGSDDATPLGVDLKGIVIETSPDAGTSNGNGVIIRTDDPVINSPSLQSTLSSYVGKPLSKALVSSIRNDIVRHMRSNDRPLVAVIIPPQEVSSGTLTLVVIPYVVGEKSVERIPSQYQRTDEQHVLDTVRAQPGDPVSASELIEDLNWLHKNPFRKVGVIFKQGRIPGTTDLTLTLKDEKPWSAFAGYSNGGTSSTGYDRVFLGGVRELPGDSFLSYQFTASPETVYSGDRFFDFSGPRAYLSQSAAYFVPFENRHALTFTGSYVHTRSRVSSFFTRDSVVWEGKAEYAIPLPVLGPASEFIAGVEAKYQNSGLIFGGTPLTPNALEIYQGFVGLRGENEINGGRLSYQLKGVVSPGGLTARNTNTAFVAVSGNAGDRARYAYINGLFDYRLPLPSDWSTKFTFGGQVATHSLPGLEEYSVGGDGSVRGYETNELTGDNGLLLQGELHLPVFRHGPMEMPVDMFAFADFGLVHDYATGSSRSILGAGLGVNAKITRNVSASAVWGHAFRKGVSTSANSNRFHVSLVAAF